MQTSATEHLFSIGAVMKPLEIPKLAYKSLTRQVYEYIRDFPGSTSRDFVADLDANKSSIRVLLLRMESAGLIYCREEDGNRFRLWYLTVDQKQSRRKPKTQHEAKQETVSSWPAITIPKQNIFSALGL